MDSSFLWKYLHKVSDVSALASRAAMKDIRRTCVLRMDSYNMFLTCLYVLLLCVNIPVDCYVHHRNKRQNLVLPSIYWNTSNAIFKADNNWHMMEVNDGDTIKIICPHISLPGYQKAKEDDDIYYKIYMVTQNDYNTCSMTRGNSTGQLPRLIVSCDKPEEGAAPKGYNINIINFSPLPIPVFEEGQSYYFYTLSTGTKEGLGNEEQQQSACHKKNMKVIFKVLEAGTPHTNRPSSSTTMKTVTPSVIDTTSPSSPKPSTTPVAVKTTVTSRGTKAPIDQVSAKGSHTSGSTTLHQTLPHHVFLLCTFIHIIRLLRT